MSQRKSILAAEESTPVGSPRRRSTRIANSPAPAATPTTAPAAAVSRRRSSAAESTSTTPAKITRAKRASLSQEVQLDDKPVASPRRTSKATRGASKSPSQEKDTKEPSRTIRRSSISKIIEEESKPEARSESPSTRRRSVRGQSSSPTREKSGDVQTPKPRGRRPSMSQVASLDVIEEGESDAKKSAKSSGDVSLQKEEKKPPPRRSMRRRSTSVDIPEEEEEKPTLDLKPINEEEVEATGDDKEPAKTADDKEPAKELAKTTDDKELEKVVEGSKESATEDKTQSDALDVDKESVNTDKAESDKDEVFESEQKLSAKDSNDLEGKKDNEEKVTPEKKEESNEVFKSPVRRSPRLSASPARSQSPYNMSPLCLSPKTPKKSKDEDAGDSEEKLSQSENDLNNTPKASSKVASPSKSADVSMKETEDENDKNDDDDKTTKSSRESSIADENDTSFVPTPQLSPVVLLTQLKPNGNLEKVSSPARASITSSPVRRSPRLSESQTSIDIYHSPKRKASSLSESDKSSSKLNVSSSDSKKMTMSPRQTPKKDGPTQNEKDMSSDSSFHLNISIPAASEDQAANKSKSHVDDTVMNCSGGSASSDKENSNERLNVIKSPRTKRPSLNETSTPKLNSSNNQSFCEPMEVDFQQDEVIVARTEVSAKSPLKLNQSLNESNIIEVDNEKERGTSPVKALKSAVFVVESEDELEESLMSSFVDDVIDDIKPEATKIHNESTKEPTEVKNEVDSPTKDATEIKEENAEIKTEVLSAEENTSKKTIEIDSSDEDESDKETETQITEEGEKDVPASDDDSDVAIVQDKPEEESNAKLSKERSDETVEILDEEPKKSPSSNKPSKNHTVIEDNDEKLEAIEASSNENESQDDNEVKESESEIDILIPVKSPAKTKPFSSGTGSKRRKLDRKSLNKSLDDLISKKMNESSDSSSDDEYNPTHEFIDDMAFEGEEDTPSDDSNEIIDEGESLHSSESERFSDDDEYENDSFIADDDEENGELLSGNEYDLDDLVVNNKTKKSRILKVSDSSDSEVETLAEAEDNASPPTETKESANTSAPKITILQDIVIPSHVATEALPSENVTLKTREEEIVKDELQNTSNISTNAPSPPRKNRRKTSINYQDQMKISQLNEEEISGKITNIVGLLVSSIKDKEKGDISVNVSLDVANNTSSDEYANSPVAKRVSPRKAEDEDIGEVVDRDEKMVVGLKDSQKKKRSSSQKRLSTSLQEITLHMENVSPLQAKKKLNESQIHDEPEKKQKNSKKRLSLSDTNIMPSPKKKQKVVDPPPTLAPAISKKDKLKQSQQKDQKEASKKSKKEQNKQSKEMKGIIPEVSEIQRKKATKTSPCKKDAPEMLIEGTMNKTSQIMKPKLTKERKQSPKLSKESPKTLSYFPSHMLDMLVEDERSPKVTTREVLHQPQAQKKTLRKRFKRERPSNSNVSDDWEIQSTSMVKPSKKNKDKVKLQVEKIKKKFAPNDFRNRMLYDSNVARMVSTDILKNKKKTNYAKRN